MHRWWSFFVVFSLFFIGCGKRVEKETAERPIQLSLWHIMNYSGPREVIERAVARFEAENPDCKVQIQTFENDGYKVKLSVELASGNAPDVMFTWGGGHLKEMVRAGKVMDLTSSLEENAWKGRFIDAALDLCSQEGRVYGVPLDLSAVLLWCNSTLSRRTTSPIRRHTRSFFRPARPSVPSELSLVRWATRTSGRAPSTSATSPTAVAAPSSSMMQPKTTRSSRTTPSSVLGRCFGNWLMQRPFPSGLTALMTALLVRASFRRNPLCC